MASPEYARLYTELTDRVRQRIRQLKESNRASEAQLLVSHDLPRSVCAIAGFTSLLRDRHYETIDAGASHCIDRVLGGTQRMSNLIDDLLALSRVTRTVHFTIAKG